jgi:signal peptidase I
MRVDSRKLDLAVSLLRSGCAIRLRVEGCSMKPLLRPGCLLRIAPVTHSLRLGDIVFYRADGGKAISHRIITITSANIRTKGDAFRHPDGAVHASRVLGKVVAIEKPFYLPLDGRLVRSVGRVLGWLYPRVVKLKMATVRFLPIPSILGAHDV